MLETALDVVRAEGVRLELANLNLESVIRAADVPRSTVFRIWPDRTAFLVELLTTVFQAAPEPGTLYDAETAAIVMRVAAADPARMRTPEGRLSAMREAGRQAMVRNLEALVASLPWRVARAVVGLTISDADPELEPLRESLREIEERFLLIMAKGYEDFAAAFGRRLRPGVTGRDIAIAAAATTEGLAERLLLVPREITEPRHVDFGGEQAEWTLAGLAITAIFEGLTEPVAAPAG